MGYTKAIGMGESQPAGQLQDGQQSVNIFDVIDVICADFRKQWKSGNRPSIENFLERVPDHASETLFRNLLPVDIRYRERMGEKPSAGEYSRRFPQFKRVIGDAFHYSTSASFDGSSGTPPDPLDDMQDTVATPAANRIGDYELVRELGRGGFGVVYEARHLKRGNSVALKTLPTGGDGQDVNAERLHRFRKEFRSLSEFNHPNLVGMQTLEVDGSQWFFTMDLIDGVDFLSHVRPDGSLDEARLRSSLKQLASGIIALHDQQVLHRDLKPSNVMVDRGDRVAILDFGLVAELEQQTDETASALSRHFAGTPRYAAPEQAFGQRSPSSDWYAFGIMLHEALTGTVPFQGCSHAELLIRKQNEDVPSIAVREELPQDLAELTDALLKREPRDRPNAEVIASILSVEFDSETHTGSESKSDGSGPDFDSDPEDVQSVLIGREEQLSQLESVQAELLETRSPLVTWLTGLSGEGKSVLAETFLRPARLGNDFLVLSGRCYDRELIPFKVIDSQIDSLVRFLRGKSDSEVEQILPQDIEKLAQLFPVLRRVASIDRRYQKFDQTLDEQTLRSLAFAALKDLLRTIGDTTPVVLFIDDLQWGDSDSADILLRILSPPAPPAILLLGTFRSDEMEDSPFLRQWNDKIAAQETELSIRQISVAALSKEECIALLDRRFGETALNIPSVVEAIYDDCKGNPYLLEQLIEGVDPNSGVHQTRSLEQIIKSRLSRCPEGARDLLETIAVGGKAVTMQEAVQVASLADSGMATLTHMRNEKLLKWIDSQEEQLVDTYHDKIRETALRLIGDERRRSIHLKYAEWIESQDSAQNQNATDWIHPRAFDLAHHYEQAEDGRAFQYLMQAGRASLDSYAMDVAVEFLRRAEQLRPDSLSRDMDYRLQMKLGRALFGSNAVDESMDYFRRAIDLGDSSIELATAWDFLGEAHWRRSEYRESLESFRKAFAAVGEKLPRTRLSALIRANLLLTRFHLMPFEFPLTSGEVERDSAFAALMYGKYGDKIAQFDIFKFTHVVARSCVVGRRLGNQSAKTMAYGSYGHFLGTAGFGWLSHQMVKRAQRLAENLSPEITGRANYHYGCHYYYFGLLDDAQRSCERSEMLLSRSGDWHLSLAVHFQRHIWSVRGNASEVMRYSKRECDLANQTGDQLVLAWGLYGCADGYTRIGDASSAIEAASEAVRIMEQLDTSTVISIAYHELGRAQIQGADYKSAVESLAKAVQLVLGLRVMEITVYAFPLYVEALLNVNWIPSSREPIPAKVGRTASRMTMLSRFFGRVFPNIRAHGFRVTGRLKVSQGRQGKAMKWFDKAIAAAEKIGAEYDKARALIDKSLCDYPQADADRARGLDLLEQLGCVLPDAEVEYLGIDREAHHRRAAAARAAYEANLAEA